MRTSNIQTLPISIVRTVRSSDESEGARPGVGEIGLRRDWGQKRCLQSQKREIEFWDGQVRLEDIDSLEGVQNAP